MTWIELVALAVLRAEAKGRKRAPGKTPWCRECRIARGVRRSRAIRDGLCSLHLSRRRALA
jgi:hypothetical protein